MQSSGREPSGVLAFAFSLHMKVASVPVTCALLRHPEKNISHNEISWVSQATSALANEVGPGFLHRSVMIQAFQSTLVQSWPVPASTQLSQMMFVLGSRHNMWHMLFP